MTISKRPRRFRPRFGPVPFLIALLLFSFPLPCRDAAGQEQDPRKVSVETGLSPAFQVQGRPPVLSSIQERMAHYRVPGVSIAVLDGGRVAWAEGYGASGGTAGLPVTPRTLFQAASISKPVAAIAVLRLVEEGTLELDAPANDYLVSWRLPENQFTRTSPVTLRHLLTHTGGTTVHGFPGYAVDQAIPTTLQVLDGSGPANTDPIRVDTLPGALWRYSGGGYTVLQQLLEDVTGTPFPVLMQELVLDPAGMDLSSYRQPLPPEKAEIAAFSHLSDGTAGDGPWHIYPEMAAAGLWTNPVELARLALDIQGSLEGEEGHLLSPSMARAMVTPGRGGWGLGFQIQGEDAGARFMHGGSNYGFKAQFMAYHRGGRGVFVMTNGDRGSALAQEILLAVVKEYGWPGPGYREVILAQVPASVLEALAGTYHVEDGDWDVEVSVVEDHLRVEVPGLRVFHLHPTAPRFFIDLDDGGRVRVDRDEDGRVEALQFLGGPRAVRVGGA